MSAFTTILPVGTLVSDPDVAEWHAATTALNKALADKKGWNTNSNGMTTTLSAPKPKDNVVFPERFRHQPRRPVPVGDGPRAA